MHLDPGDSVAIIAPASQFRGADRHLLERAKELLEHWDLRVHIHVDDRHHFYLAGDDASRANHLSQALSDNRIRALFCTRGGYGSARLEPWLKRIEVDTHKLLVGYSDFCALQCAAMNLWPLARAIHGPNIATNQLLDDSPEADGNRTALRDALFNPDWRIESAVEILRPGDAAGPIVGGCLSMIVSTIGTISQPRFDDCIVFLEDVGEAPFRIDRMLTQLLNAGMLTSAAGVVFGAMTGCKDPYNNLSDVIIDRFSDAAYPVVMGFASGHGPRNQAFRIGAAARLDGAARRLYISQHTQ